MFKRLLATVLLIVSSSAFAESDLATPCLNQRGHRWIRAHPFTIVGLVRMTPKPFDAEQYKAAGFSALLAWEPGTFDKILPIASAHQLPYHLELGRWGDEESNRDSSNYNTLLAGLNKLESKETRTYLEGLLKHPGCIGWLVNDEAVRPTYLRYTRHMLKLLRELHPDGLAYANAHPAGHEGNFGYGSLDRYLDEFAAMVEPDVLMTDIYPLAYPDGTSDDYFKLLAALRRTALAHGMPYWLFIQSFETHGSWDRRLPSESDLRFQLFVPLTYGYTGLAYFTYDIAFERGLIEADGKPNALYHAASKVNPEVACLGRVLRFLHSTDVRYVQGTHKDGAAVVPNPLPRDTKVWTTGAGGDSHILDVAVDSSDERPADPALLELRQNKDGLLGFFRDDEGRQLFMLTNMWHGAAASATERSLEFTIKLDPKVKELFRLNRITGKPDRLDVAEGIVHIGLPGGTGELFAYESDSFSRIDATSEIQGQEKEATP